MKKRMLKIWAIFTVVTMMNQIVFPTVAWALTSGPASPEAASFSSIGSADMVDLSSGDLKYEIPLLDVGGYPISLSYNQEVTMEQEASWVGLGWSLNPGAVNRDMKGLPDDFAGEKVEQQLKVKKKSDWGVSASLNLEALGADTEESKKAAEEAAKAANKGVDVGVGTLTIGVKKDSYKGWGIDLGLSPQLSLNILSKTSEVEDETTCDTIKLDDKLFANLGLDMNMSSWGGSGINPSVSLSRETDKKRKDGSIWTQTSGASLSLDPGNRNVSFSFGAFATVSQSFPSPSYIPSIRMPYSSTGMLANVGIGVTITGTQTAIRVKGHYNVSKLKDNVFNTPAYGYLYEDRGYEQFQEDTYYGHNWLMDFNRENDQSYTAETQHMPLPNHTHDVFNASGAGLNTQFRAHRNDVGYLYDATPENTESAISGKLGLDIGIPNPAGSKVGVDGFGGSISSSEHGKWFPGGQLMSMSTAIFNELSGTDGSAEIDKLLFEPEINRKGSNSKYTSFQLRSLGEFEGTNKGFRDAWANNKPSRVTIKKHPVFGNIATLTDHLESEALTSEATTDEGGFNAAKKWIENPTPVAQQISYLTAEEATLAGLDREIFHLNHGTQEWSEVHKAQKMDRIDGNGVKKAHHLSEITVKNADGSRYIYGIPVYNNVYEEASFNVVKEGAFLYDCKTNTVGYVKDVANSLGNENGVDHFFQSKKLPPYATTYLLTGVVSSDYRDITGNGISDDDQGTGTKFYYTQKHENFAWRFPFCRDAENPRASHNKVHESNHFDDQGNYTYGEKEIWYLQSIESRDFVAIFHKSDRKDALGVVGRNGGVETGKKLDKLDKIELFNKEELLQNGDAAVPIKTVHFTYGYDLCNGVPNQWDHDESYDYEQNPLNYKHGKLTLHSVHFTYGKSNRGASSPYKFHYADPQHTAVDQVVMDASKNAHYDPKDNDRWGQYKNFDCVGSQANLADYYVDGEGYGMWKLNTIDLPSGGRIEIDYEPDDYAFVQDKRAMNMVKIKAFAKWDEGSNDPGDESIGELKGNELYGDKKSDGINDVVVFDLWDPIENMTEQEAIDAVLKRYFRDPGQADNENQTGIIENVKFRTRVLCEGAPETEKYETIEGYASIKTSEIGVRGSGGIYDEAYVRLHHANWFLDEDRELDKQVPTSHRTKKDGKKSKIHPISWTAWDFIRMNNPNMLFNTSAETEDQSLDDALGELAASFDDMFSFFKKYTTTLRRKGYAQEVDLDASWIRLYNPRMRKIGGGSRVKKIAISDNWQALSGASTSDVTQTYGTEYSYDRSFGSLSISSGVATYEPILGQEENVWRQLEMTAVKQKRLPHMNFYFERPYGESFFPSPKVTYARVKVQNTVPDGDYKNNGTTLHEFYTTFDNPTKVEFTTVDKTKLWQGAYIPLVLKSDINVYTNSQGYVIETNDIDGRPKATWYLQEDEELHFYDGAVYRYGTQYKYVQDDEGNFSNLVKTMNRDGTINDQQELGVMMDVMVDTRASRNFIATGDVDFNLDLPIFTPPFALPTLWVSGTTRETTYRSVVLNKVIHKKVIPSGIVTFVNGATTSAENLVYDALTGQSLLTRTKNEFGTWVYSQNFLARWAYEQMGASYENYRTLLMGVTFDQDGAIDAADNLGSNTLQDLLNPGDRVLATDIMTQGLKISRGPMHKKPLTVAEKDNKLYLINSQGEIVSIGALAGNADNRKVGLLVIGSGKSNQLAASVGSIASADAPPIDLGNSGNATTNTSANVLSASALEYKDDWNLYCCGELDDSYTPDGWVDQWEVATQLDHNKNFKFTTINPYLKHQKGTMRPYKTYAYQGERNQLYASANEEVLIKESGYIDNFKGFWKFDANGLVKTDEADDAEWQMAKEVTIIDPKGLELESKDALGRYTSAVMGYQRKYPIAVGNNAKLTQIAFDGFEDYDFGLGELVKMVYPRHFSFVDRLGPGSDASVSSDHSHTGDRSLVLTTPQFVAPGTEVSVHMNRALPDQTCITGPEHIDMIENNDCIPQFKPEPGEYIISAWVKEDQAASNIAYTNAFLKVEELDNSYAKCSIQDNQDQAIEYKFFPSGPIIDGWQRIIGRFTVHGECADCYGQTNAALCSCNPLDPVCTPTEYIRVILGLQDGRGGTQQPYNAYFDDVRIFPVNGVMNSYVYDPITQRLLAVLDENNYATFYEYSIDGNLERVKKETEKGIMTIQETRQHINQ